MATKKAGTYHHGNLRAALLAEAKRTIEASGEAALSLRACARAVGVDIAASYRHFRNKGELLAAVAAGGFEELGAQMQQAMQDIGRRADQAEAYFSACGRAYIDFGLGRKHLYQLMFSDRCTSEAIAIQRRASGGDDVSPPYSHLCDALDLLVEAQLISAESRQGAEFVAWSAVHGLVSLLLAKRGAKAKNDIEQATLHAILWGLAHGTSSGS
jgi:AcrR family transcriptional regulator